MAVNIAGVAHYTVCVSDLERGRRFYTEVLGLEQCFGRPDYDLSPEDGGPWHETQAPGMRVHIMSTPDRPIVSEGYGPHMALHVPTKDFHETVETIRQRIAEKDLGGEIWIDSVHHEATNMWQAFLRDPDGNQIELTDETPRRQPLGA